MKKNIFYSYGFDISNQDRIEHIQSVGFDGVFISLEAEDFLTAKEIQEIVKSSLSIETLHLPAKGYINTIWEKGNQGDIFIEELKNDVQIAAFFHIKRVILHLNSKPIHPKPSAIGIERINRLLQFCKQFNIYLCIENNRDMEHIFYVFNHLNDDNLRFCFDIGHANAFTKNVFEFLNFSFVREKLECLHIHDNDGTQDQHHLPFQGNVNWQRLMPLLMDINPKLNLTLEIHPYGIIKSYPNDLEFLKDAYQKLCILESFCKKN